MHEFKKHGFRKPNVSTLMKVTMFNQISLVQKKTSDLEQAWIRTEAEFFKMRSFENEQRLRCRGQRKVTSAQSEVVCDNYICSGSRRGGC